VRHGDKTRPPIPTGTPQILRTGALRDIRRHGIAPWGDIVKGEMKPQLRLTAQRVSIIRVDRKTDHLGSGRPWPSSVEPDLSGRTAR
jgi:hypothetical protein